MANKEFQPRPEEKEDRPKIQDIIPRKDRNGSLLANIMGPRPAVLHSEQNSAGTFLRSLSFGRGKRKNQEKVIYLKKSVLPEKIPVSFADFRGKKRAPFSGRVSKKPLMADETRKNIEARTVAQSVFSVRFRRSYRIVLFWGVASVAAVIVLLSFVFAKATIFLEPSVAILSLEGIRIETGPGVAEIDIAGKRIPAFLTATTSSLRKEFSPSVRERVSRKALGTVRIYNAFNSLPQTLIARTRFQDSAGRIFRLKQRVVVPGAAIQDGRIVPRSVSAAVEAERAGEEFNIGPARFTIPGFAGTAKFAGFYAESSDAFTGGFEGEAMVVRQADIDAASEEVTAALFARLKQELEQEIPAGAAVIPGAREITVTALRKPRPGEIQDRFAVEADGRAVTMLFRMDDLFSLLGKLALAPDAEKKVSREKSHLEFDRVSLSLKNKTLSFDIRGTIAAVSVLAPDGIQRAVNGRTRSDAENILRADSRIRAFGISLFPFWRNTIPSDAGKIRIFVQE